MSERPACLETELDVRAVFQDVGRREQLADKIVKLARSADPHDQWIARRKIKMLLLTTQGYRGDTFTRMEDSLADR